MQFVCAGQAPEDPLAAGNNQLNIVARKAVARDGSTLITVLDGHQSLYVLGRGPALVIAKQGAHAFITSARASAATRLPFTTSTHRTTDAPALIVAFYGFVEALSRHRGFNPDQPPHLRRVTETT